MKVTISCGGKFHAFNLAEQLDKKGYLHKLITTFYSKKRVFLPNFRTDIEEINPNRVITNMIPILLDKLLFNIPGLKSLITRDVPNKLFDEWAQNQLDKCDIVTIWSNAAFYTIKAAKRIGAKSILERGSTHIVFQKEILEEEYNKYNLKIKPIPDSYVQYELAEYIESDYISVGSNFAKQTYIDKGIDRKRIIQIPYGVDLNVFRKINKEDNVFRVLFVGNLSLRKGVHYLLDAFSKLKLKNSELLLIGPLSPEMRPFLAKYEGSYKYLGPIIQLELYKYLSQGSVFVLPSIEEGLALIILQAMACGLPVICTSNSGGIDVVRDGIDGFIIPIRNIESIKEKINLLYTKLDFCQSMGNSALSSVKENYTWNHYGERIVNSYKEILQKNKL